MTPFEVFLVQYGLYHKTGKRLTVSRSLANDPQVKKLCSIQGASGNFLGTTLKVVPDVQVDGE
jgi:hypothetical protein